MKSIFTYIGALFYVCTAFAQVPDFTVTDIDGNQHNLYSYLEDGKVVILDVSATWCSNCWNFHKEKFLEDIMEKYGPAGTDQAMVIFYEGDKNTGQSALEGGAGSQGNWLEGSNYPFINENPLTIDMSVFSSGFPTVNVIRPDDKLIIADLNDNFKNGGGLAAMEEIIEGAFPVTSSIKDLDEINVLVYPNPFISEIIVDLTATDFEYTSVQMIDVSGRILQTKENIDSNKFILQTSDLTNGIYFIQIMNGDQIIGTQKLSK